MHFVRNWHKADVPRLSSDVRFYVIERMGTTESTTLALKREDGGKILVASLLWEVPR
jgi:hypothetical protein